MGKGPVGVRVLVVAKKRVRTVERRGTGEWCWTTWESHLTRGRVVPRGFALGCPGTTGLGIRRRTDSGPSRSCGMSGAASLRGWCDSSKTLSRVPEPVHQDHELESRMRENRLSGLGGGRRPKAVLYPHRRTLADKNVRAPLARFGFHHAGSEAQAPHVAAFARRSQNKRYQGGFKNPQICSRRRQSAHFPSITEISADSRRRPRFLESALNVMKIGNSVLTPSLAPGKILPMANDWQRDRTRAQHLMTIWHDA